MSHKKTIILLALLVIYLVVAAATSVILTPEDIAAQDKKASAVSGSKDGKDMAGYVAELWDSKIIPEFRKEAIDINTVISGLKEDPKDFAAKYGKHSNELSPMNYIVKGTAKIKTVSTKSAVGTIELEINDLSGKKSAVIQIGPVIQKSAIRDSLSFISFNDFVNQIEYGEFNKEVNKYIMKNVVAGLREKDLAGKEVTFLGAFTEDRRGKVLITPVELSIKGE